MTWRQTAISDWIIGMGVATCGWLRGGELGTVSKVTYLVVPLGVGLLAVLLLAWSRTLGGIFSEKLQGIFSIFFFCILFLVAFAVTGKLSGILIAWLTGDWNASVYISENVEYGFISCLPVLAFAVFSAGIKRANSMENNV